jgi:hypothetical protein
MVSTRWPRAKGGACATGAGLGAQPGDHVRDPRHHQPDHLRENIARADWRPADAVLAEADALVNRRTVSGPRYPASMQATMDTEEFAD